MTKKVHSIFVDSLFGVTIILALSIFMFLRTNKDKSAFIKISGKITAIEHPDNRDKYPNHEPLKFRYIQLENYAFPFELFIGKDAGDFKPAFEQLDQLHPGDIISVYVSDQNISEDDPVNRFAQFIDKDNKPYFIKGSWDKGMAIFIAGVGIAILVLVLILKKKGKIT